MKGCGVPLEEPRWWYEETGANGRIHKLLGPVGRIYGALVERRFRRGAPYRSKLPVICIGNFTAGGTGKTPLSLRIARHLIGKGEAPVFLTRGYGGRTRGPAWVDRSLDTARDVGDEPLLLAEVAPVVVSRDRQKGAELIEAAGPRSSVIIMDDGLQNPSLAKDLTIAVVDGRRGLGNGAVIPAGPLRAPLEFQLGLVEAIVVNEPDAQGEPGESRIHSQLKRVFPGPVLVAGVRARGDVAWLSGAPVVAYSGIGNPQRFFSLVERLGARLIEKQVFKDHHDFSDADAERLLGLAQSHAAQLVTTEKDLARLISAGGVRGALREATRVLAIEMAFDERELGRLVALVDSVVAKREGSLRAVQG